MSRMDGVRGNEEAADGEFGAAKLFHSHAVLFAALLGLALLYFLLILLVGFVARIENVRDVEKDAKNQQ